MTNLPMFPEHNSGRDDTPLPLLVAKKWGFPPGQLLQNETKLVIEEEKEIIAVDQKDKR